MSIKVTIPSGKTFEFARSANLAIYMIELIDKRSRKALSPEEIQEANEFVRAVEALLDEEESKGYKDLNHMTGELTSHGDVP